MRSTLLPLLLSGCSLVITGCAFEPTTSSDSPVTGSPLTGIVHGGQQPISNARIYVLAASTTAYAGAVTSLLTSGSGSDSLGTYSLTDSYGGFSLSHYTCVQGTQVYLLAEGGNPGLTAGTDNEAARLMVMLGTCPASGNFAATIPTVAINEETTVAAAYALAPFATDATHMGSGSSAAAQLGLTNAAATAMNLVNITNGAVRATTAAVSGYSSSSGLSANGTVPATRINTLANIVAACVNSNGTGTACSLLFGYTTANSVIPTDIIAALMNIAHAPGTNVTPLFNLNTEIAPFQPSLTTAPSDWTLSVAYTAPNLTSPRRAAVDSEGNIWVPDATSNSLAELSPTGVVLSGTTGFTGGGMDNPTAAGVNPSNGDVYVTNASGSMLSVFANGSPVAAGGYGTGAANYGVSFAANGSAMLSGSSGLESASLLGVVLSLINLSGTSYGVTVDSSGSAWGVSYSGNTLNTLVLGLPASYSGGALSSPTGIATDSSGRFWISNSGNSKLSLFTSSGSPVTSTGYSGGGLSSPWGLAVDGLNTVWVANANGTVSAFSNSGSAISPATGYVTGASTAAYNLAIDGSGNIWVPNTNGTVYEIVGAAAPVVTPWNNTKAGVRP